MIRRTFKRRVRRCSVYPWVGAVQRYRGLQHNPLVRMGARAWIEWRRRRYGPDQIDVEVTSFCNVRCLSCPHAMMVRPKGTMDEALFARVVHLAAHDGVKRVNLGNIGEPLLDPRLPARVALAREGGMEVCLHTNGAAMTRNLVRDLVEAGVDHVSVSMWGATRATHEALQPGVDHDRVVQGIDDLCALRRDGRPYVSVTFVRQPGNEHEVGAFLRAWRHRVDDVALRDVRSWAGAVSVGAGFDSRELRPDLPLDPCKHLWARMVVLHDGRVPMCAIDYEGAVILGDLRHQGVREVWQGPAARALRQVPLAAGRGALPLCGSCRVRERWW